MDFTPNPLAQNSTETDESSRADQPGIPGNFLAPANSTANQATDLQATPAPPPDSPARRYPSVPGEHKISSRLHKPELPSDYNDPARG